jgi:hypothetical protein
MTDYNLTLRPTVIAGERLADDYCVRRDGRSVGCIRLAHERTGQSEGWDWSINVPLPVVVWVGPGL